MTRIEVALDLVTLTCTQAGCGVTFAVPEVWNEAHRRSHETFYCPNGHARWYPQESTEEQLRKKVASLQGNLNYEREYSARVERERKAAERSRNAMKGVATKLKKKALAGECAFCHETFGDYRAHVEEAHAGEDPNQHAEEAASGEQPA